MIEDILNMTDSEDTDIKTLSMTSWKQTSKTMIKIGIKNIFE